MQKNKAAKIKSRVFIYKFIIGYQLSVIGYRFAGCDCYGCCDCYDGCKLQVAG